MMPPFALTHAKYAAAMLPMSLKSVPGCFVLIEPTGIGVPVALTPGLGPHDEVLALALLEALVALAELAADAPLEVNVELLLPQPAIRTIDPSAASRPIRPRSARLLTLTLTLSPPP